MPAPLPHIPELWQLQQYAKTSNYAKYQHALRDESDEGQLQTALQGVSVDCVRADIFNSLLILEQYATYHMDDFPFSSSNSKVGKKLTMLARLAQDTRLNKKEQTQITTAIAKIKAKTRYNPINNEEPTFTTAIAGPAEQCRKKAIKSVSVNYVRNQILAELSKADAAKARQSVGNDKTRQAVLFKLRALQEHPSLSKAEKDKLLGIIADLKRYQHNPGSDQPTSTNWKNSFLNVMAPETHTPLPESLENIIKQIEAKLSKMPIAQLQQHQEKLRDLYESIDFFEPVNTDTISPTKPVIEKLLQQTQELESAKMSHELYSRYLQLAKQINNRFQSNKQVTTTELQEWKKSIESIQEAIMGLSPAYQKGWHEELKSISETPALILAITEKTPPKKEGESKLKLYSTYHQVDANHAANEHVARYNVLKKAQELIQLREEAKEHAKSPTSLEKVKEYTASSNLIQKELQALLHNPATLESFKDSDNLLTAIAKLCETQASPPKADPTINRQVEKEVKKIEKEYQQNARFIAGVLTDNYISVAYKEGTKGIQNMSKIIAQRTSPVLAIELIASLAQKQGEGNELLQKKSLDSINGILDKSGQATDAQIFIEILTQQQHVDHANKLLKNLDLSALLNQGTHPPTIAAWQEMKSKLFTPKAEKEGVTQTINKLLLFAVPVLFDPQVQQKVKAHIEQKTVPKQTRYTYLSPGVSSDTVANLLAPYLGNDSTKSIYSLEYQVAAQITAAFDNKNRPPLQENQPLEVNLAAVLQQLANANRIENITRKILNAVPPPPILQDLSTQQPGIYTILKNNQNEIAKLLQSTLTNPKSSPLLVKVIEAASQEDTLPPSTQTIITTLLKNNAVDLLAQELRSHKKNSRSRIGITGIAFVVAIVPAVLSLLILLPFRKSYRNAISIIASNPWQLANLLSITIKTQVITKMITQIIGQVIRPSKKGITPTTRVSATVQNTTAANPATAELDNDAKIRVLQAFIELKKQGKKNKAKQMLRENMKGKQEVPTNASSVKLLTAFAQEQHLNVLGGNSTLIAQSLIHQLQNKQIITSRTAQQTDLIPVAVDIPVSTPPPPTMAPMAEVVPLATTDIIQQLDRFIQLKEASKSKFGQSQQQGQSIRNEPLQNILNKIGITPTDALRKQQSLPTLKAISIAIQTEVKNSSTRKSQADTQLLADMPKLEKFTHSSDYAKELKQILGQYQVNLSHPVHLEAEELAKDQCAIEKQESQTTAALQKLKHRDNPDPNTGPAPTAPEEPTE